MQSTRELEITPTPGANAEGCPLCGNRSNRNVRREPEGQLVRCQGCGFMYVSPRPTALELKALYDDEYFSHDDLASCLQFRSPVFDQCLAKLSHLVEGNRRKILDVGCGTGEFVAHAISKGWDATGIESSATAARFARSENGLPVHHAVLETELFPANCFDVVTLLDVLEHLLMPKDEMRRVFALLKPGGVAVVRLPNIIFHLAKARIISRLGISESSLEMRYHLNHFSPRTLTELLRRVGFQVITVEVGAAETKAHAAWASPSAKRSYVKAATALRTISGVNLGNIMVAYARKPL